MKYFTSITLLFIVAVSLLIPSCSGEYPVADFDIIKITCDTTCRVQFQNKSQDAASFVWNFGDGISSNEDSPLHEYRSNGDYVATLKAISVEGVAKVSEQVVINQIQTSSNENDENNENEDNNPPNTSSTVKVYENGNLVYEISSFTGIRLADNLNIIVEYDTIQEINMQSNESVAGKLNRSVNNDIWTLRFNGSVSSNPEIVIKMPTLEYLETESSGDIIGSGLFSVGGTLDIKISSTGKISLNAERSKINTMIFSSGEVELTGKTDESNVDINSSGNFSGFGLYTRKTSVKSQGSGQAQIRVSDTLSVVIKSSGSIYYKGNPRKIDLVISGGTGSLINQN